jgi:hypothetical protein
VSAKKPLKESYERFSDRDERYRICSDERKDNDERFKDRDERFKDCDERLKDRDERFKNSGL